MAGIAHPITTELDGRLLATPFREQTNWHVITGAPSCGKTTLVDLLAERGFRIVPEIARQFIENEMSKGHSIDGIHRHGAALQRRLLEIQLNVEEGLLATDVLFLDGSIPASLAWFRLFGLDPNDALLHCFQHRYASVFVLDPLPLDLDGLRFEDGAFAGFLDEWIERDFAALGYHVNRVPVMSPEDRLGYVLERLPPPANPTLD
jgi:predicted ATPase